MEIGLVQVMQSFMFDGITDAEVYDQELRCAILADELGYDHVWTVEHHFEDYSFCPDNFVYLAHVAAKTKRIKVATGACIIPWNAQPLRVAEKAALLDQLAPGRFIFGMGRGLARREFSQFGVSMDESRERFDEASPLILASPPTPLTRHPHPRLNIFPVCLPCCRADAVLAWPAQQLLGQPRVLRTTRTSACALHCM